MNRTRLSAALTAIHLAMQDVLLSSFKVEFCRQEVFKKAKSYGAATTTEDDIATALAMFDWSYAAQIANRQRKSVLTPEQIKGIQEKVDREKALDQYHERSK